MNITLKEIGNKKNSFTFPSLPERITVNRSAKYKTHDLLNGNTSKLPKGKECVEVSWDGIFFGAARKKQSYIRKWTGPKACEKTLRRWLNKGTPLKLLVTGTNINIDVTISKLTTNSEGAFGDLAYSIEFTQYNALKIKTMKELKKKKKKSSTNSRPSTQKNGGTYTVISGDSLWKIAQSKLGNGSRWSEIYSLNKKSIEDTAKKKGYKSSNNGSLIFPGQKLTLPAA